MIRDCKALYTNFVTGVYSVRASSVERLRGFIQTLFDGTLN